MRVAVAALVDTLATALLAYGGFRLADWATPCSAGQASCAPLAPAVVIAVLLAVALYYGAGYVLWRTAPARKLFGLDQPATSRRDS